MRTPIEYCQPACSQPLEQLRCSRTPSRRAAASTPVAPARSTRAISSSTKRSDPALGVRRALPQADVQHLAACRRGWRGSGDSRSMLRVPVARRPASGGRRPHRRSCRHRSPAAPRPGRRPPARRARAPRPSSAVELADMPERERAQKRPQRRGRRHPAAQQPARAARAQHVAVIDAVGAQHHRVDQRHHLAARVRRARPVTPQPHQLAAPAPRSPAAARASRPARSRRRDTTRSSSNSTRTPSSPTGSSSCTIEGDLLSQAPAAAISR